MPDGEYTDFDFQDHNGLDSQDGIDRVMQEIHGIAAGDSTSSFSPQPKRPSRSSAEEAYAEWAMDRTPENMTKVVSALSPTINSEIMRYSGPKSLLRSKAKALVARAAKTYDPASGAKFQSWVVTNLQPLARYSVRQRDVRTPEVAARQAAAVARATDDLRDELGRDPTDDEIADEIGISAKRVRDVRAKAVASVNSGRFDEAQSEDASQQPGVFTPDQLPFASEAVYQGLSPMDRKIFDSVTGMHGARQIPARDVASMLKISPAQVSGRAKAIADEIAWIVNNG